MKQSNFLLDLVVILVGFASQEDPNPNYPRILPVVGQNCRLIIPRWTKHIRLFLAQNVYHGGASACAQGIHTYRDVRTVYIIGFFLSNFYDTA